MGFWVAYMGIEGGGGVAASEAADVHYELRSIRNVYPPQLSRTNRHDGLKSVRNAESPLIGDQ